MQVNAFDQIPDELVEHYLGKSGFQCPDVRLYVFSSHSYVDVSAIQPAQISYRKIVWIAHKEDMIFVCLSRTIFTRFILCLELTVVFKLEYDERAPQPTFILLGVAKALHFCQVS